MRHSNGPSHGHGGHFVMVTVSKCGDDNPPLTLQAAAVSLPGRPGAAAVRTATVLTDWAATEAKCQCQCDGHCQKTRLPCRSKPEPE